MKSLKMQLFTLITIMFTNFLLLNTIVKAEKPTWVVDKNSGCKIWLSLQSSESIAWLGECVDGKAHGNGTLVIYKNTIENSKIYCTTKNGLTMADGHLTVNVDTSAYNFSIFEDDRYRHTRLWNIKGIVNKDINLSYKPVADYIMEKAGYFALKNCSRKNHSQRVTVLLFQDGNDNYAVRGVLQLTNDTNKLRWLEYDNIARDKHISQEDEEYNAKLKEKKRLEQEEKARYQAKLAEKKRLEEEKKRQEMEVRERQEEERKRQEIAALRAKEEQKRAEAIKRRDEFVKNNSVEEWPDISELYVNPFVYEGKIIAIQTDFETMQTATQGIFGGKGETFFVVSDIQKGMFRESGLIVVLAGRVLGKTELQVPLLGLMQVPHLKFVGVHFCQDYNCNDIIPKRESHDELTSEETLQQKRIAKQTSLEKNTPKFQLLSYIKSKNSQKILDTKIGEKQCVPDSDYKVTVKDFIPDAELKQEPINKSDKPDNPAIFMKLFDSEKIVAEGWLVANDHNYYEDKNQNLRLEHIWLPSQEELEKVIESIETAHAKISVAIAGQELSQDFHMGLNKVFKLEGTDYTIRMLQYVLNYGDRRPISEQPPDNPAVQVEINGPEGTETRWVFEKFPDWEDKMHPAKHKNLKLTCSEIASVNMAKNTVKIFHSQEGKQVIVYIKDKHIVETMPWELGKKYTIAGLGNQIMVSDYFPSFDFKREVIKKSDQTGVPAILVEVEGPSGKFEDWLFSNNQYATWYPDNNFALVYELISK
ncbi:MAG: hypothetical protein HUU08_12270 [Candidatus Brocadia sp.]|nr:hypothetical protein [Candidatus Brocadia sp.]